MCIFPKRFWRCSRRPVDGASFSSTEHYTSAVTSRAWEINKTKAENEATSQYIYTAALVVVFIFIAAPPPPGPTVTVSVTETVRATKWPSHWQRRKKEEEEKQSKGNHDLGVWLWDKTLRQCHPHSHNQGTGSIKWPLFNPDSCLCIHCELYPAWDCKKQQLFQHWHFFIF